MNPNDAHAWQDGVLEEIFAGIAANDALTDILIFKGARILARQLPGVARQSLDIDANCTKEFLATYPDRQVQAGVLQEHLLQALHQQFERGVPVRFRVEDIRVSPKPRKDHPQGWNAFEVRIRVSDMSRSSQLGVPSLQIDIAYPEELTPESTTTIEIDGHEIRAYTLCRIAGEKVRAFLSSLPDYQAKIGRAGGIVRAKDIYDLARILKHCPLTVSKFWRESAIECQSACASRYVDCHGWTSFSQFEDAVRNIYEMEPTIPRDVSFDEAWQALREIIGRFVELGAFPIHSSKPTSPRSQ